jgi:hypothetical protein
VAPGSEAGGDGGITAPDDNPTDAYVALIGTSMATPAVAGASALVIQYWKARNAGKLPSPAVVKALLICGARDLGAAGPNFDYGYGAVDVRQSLRESRKGSIVTIGNPSVGNDKENKVPLKLPAGVTRVAATLVWDDRAAAANANPALVNDLDLALIEPNAGATRLPWRLDPTSPADDATRGTDSRNNVEQVEHANPGAGTWTMRVRGFAVPKAPQPYALCVRLEGATAPWTFAGTALGGQIWATIAGRTITANTTFNQTANDVAAAYAAAVNADATLAALGITATAAGATVTINGVLAHQVTGMSMQDEGLTGSLIADVAVEWFNKTTLTWQSAVVGSGKNTVHDVVRGKTSELPVGAGAGETCIAPGTTGTSKIDNDVPPLGTAFWYLVRGRNALATGSYGHQSDGQERLTQKCPG